MRRLFTTVRTNSAVSGTLPIPGPMARTDLPSDKLIQPRHSSRARSEIVPASVSGSGSVMYSIPREATMGKALAAVATVTKPAPARSAALAASAAAPVFPTEPGQNQDMAKTSLVSVGLVAAA